jgi:hypothetical protein
MASPPGAGPPPNVPLRHLRWPGRKTPRWVYPAAFVLLVAAVLVGVAVHPTKAQRATDLGGFLHDMTFDIQSCAGGVREALTRLHAIEAGTNHDVKTAVAEATYGAGNCSPANNELLGDLVQYQVHESLARFHLERAVAGLVKWATPDAQRVQQDVAVILRSKGASRAAATAKLQRDLRVLDAQRAAVNKLINTAVAATAAKARPLPLPG